MADITVSSLTRLGMSIAQARLFIATFGDRPPIYVDEFTNPFVASSNSLRAATASVTTERTTTSFVSTGVNALANAPRQIAFVTAGTTPADAPASALVTGTDVDGNVITETVAIAQTATSSLSTKFFSSITSVVEAVGDGTGATISIGVGGPVGLRKMPKVRGGTINVINETSVGARVTTGTFVVPASAPPYGSYSPATAADGTRDYVLAYELDLA